VIPRAYIIDLVVEEKLLIEIKSVSRIEPIHMAQVLRHGIKRILHPDLSRVPAKSS
jgi:GxxExxY protein